MAKKVWVKSVDVEFDLPIRNNRGMDAIVLVYRSDAYSLLGAGEYNTYRVLHRTRRIARMLKLLDLYMVRAGILDYQRSDGTETG